jgi:hypothetical protein
MASVMFLPGAMLTSGLTAAHSRNQSWSFPLRALAKTKYSDLNHMLGSKPPFGKFGQEF